jgi:hypothetical protein
MLSEAVQDHYVLIGQALWQTRRIETTRHDPRMADKQRIMCLTPGRAAPGMALATPVRDPEGSILLTAETVLDPALLERLIRRGVKVISVRIPDYRDEATIAREQADIRARIDTIFRGPGSVSRSQLRDAVLDYRIGSAQ